MSKTARRRMRAGAAMCFAAVVGSASAALAGADPGTDGAGYTYFPTVSPYISYATVTRCLGMSGGAIMVRGKVTVGNSTAYGPYSVWPFDSSSNVYLERVGSYYGNWYCKKIY